jgi:ribosomal protein L37E
MNNLTPTYEILHKRGGDAIRCRLCGRTSHHLQDVHYRYCPACHIFHDTEGARLVQAASAAWHLCESLLACPGATPELISGVRDALAVALRPFRGERI